MIKILSLCAALLAPESTGLDPHGRALHLKLDADFNTSYEACITTNKQARKYGIDPFVATALMYKTTKFSPKLAKKSKMFRKVQKLYGCDPGQDQFIRSSCSPFMLFAPHLASFLEETYRNKRIGSDYRAAILKFLKNNRRNTKVVENMAKRFADCYSRTHTYYTWNNPFRNSKRLPPPPRQHAQIPPQNGPRTLPDPQLQGLLRDLRHPQPYDHQNERLQRKMQYDIQILYSILGPGFKIEAKSRDSRNPEYYVYGDRRDLRNMLINAASNTSADYNPHTFREHNNGAMVLLLGGPKLKITFTPYGENTYFVKIQ